MEVERDSFYLELKQNLSQSNAAERKVWAKKIVTEQLSIQSFSQLLFTEPKTSMRFLWLLGELSEISPTTLFKSLPYLLSIRKQISCKETSASFAKFWLEVGIPEENEAEAIQLLLEWLRSPNSNTTTLGRVVKVLKNITLKYPELANEIQIHIDEQHSKRNL